MSKKDNLKITKKIICYKIRLKDDNPCLKDKGNDDKLENIFKQVKQKINGIYENLEERGLIFTYKLDNTKYFLDVKGISYYNKTKSEGKQCIINCILYKLREDDFPYLFNITTGVKSAIGINQSDTLMEQTHFIVMPELKVLISEYNHQGANIINRLYFVLEEILGASQVNGFKVEYMLNSDTAYRIRNLKKIKKIQLKAGHQGFETISKYFKIGTLDAMNNIFGNSQDLEYEIIIKGKGKCNSKSSKYIEIDNLEEFKDLCNKIHNSEEPKKLDIQKAKILDPTYNSNIPLDLFEERLVTEVSAIKLYKNTKYIDSDDMFKKLLKIYAEDKFELSNFKSIEI